MVELLREGMDAGATGLSSGVFYATGAAADIDELALLARVAGDAGGVYTTHIRDESDKVIESLDEAFATGRRGSVPVVVSHHKCAGPRNWGRTVQTLAHIDAARTQQPIALDMYPYIAGSTVLRKQMVDGVIDIMVTWSTPHPEMAGRMLARHCGRMGLHAAGGVREAAARRRMLLPDARGRRAAGAQVSGHHDRLRTASRTTSIRIRGYGEPSPRARAITAASWDCFRSRPPCTR